MKARFFKDPEKIEEVIRKCQVCHVGIVDENNKPYVFAMNFGYNDGIIYLHSAPHGKKIDILMKNPDIFVVFSTDHQLYFQSEHVACSYGMKYISVHISGKVEFIDDYDEKVKALHIIMNNYTNKAFDYNSPSVKNVCVFRVVADEMTGKEFGHIR
ncbi:MAG: pyridoxamine 5'-phosphate oxidase family protein [Bacteroidia bacterium]|nr:pyridoxamine 5'-phosphate oxidase family protein [Bacteroidia bacterium]